MKPINVAALRIAKRADQNSVKQLVESFVDVGSLFHALDTADHQVLYGRRGTGKTHVLTYLVAESQKKGVAAAKLDMRTIGSSGGLYADVAIPLAVRATRLLVDTLIAIHSEILDVVSNCEDGAFDLSTVGDALNEYLDAASQVVVEEALEIEESGEHAFKESLSASAAVTASTRPVSAGVGAASEATSNRKVKSKATGQPRVRVNFGSVQRELKKVVGSLPQGKLLLVMDEWSEIPLSLQPYLADLLRRSIFPAAGVRVKIAAIRQRTNFRTGSNDGGYTGFEVGADVAAGLDLDEYLVFDNSASDSIDFFQKMIWRHLVALEDKPPGMPELKSSDDLVRECFTQITALEELARAAEGIPRDAINILSLAATKANKGAISVQNIRDGALSWFQANKQSALAIEPEAERLLSWIVDKVIKGKKARAFLVSVAVRDRLIDFLYDSRAIHLIKQGSSAQDVPGERFNVYSLDYGLYVDLINTIHAPKGLLLTNGAGENYVEVPANDFRSIRRSILRLEDFYEGLGPEESATPLAGQRVSTSAKVTPVQFRLDIDGH